MSRKTIDGAGAAGVNTTKARVDLWRDLGASPREIERDLYEPRHPYEIPEKVIREILGYPFGIVIGDKIFEGMNVILTDAHSADVMRANEYFEKMGNGSDAITAEWRETAIQTFSKRDGYAGNVSRGQGDYQKKKSVYAERIKSLDVPLSHFYEFVCSANGGSGRAVIWNHIKWRQENVDNEVGQFPFVTMITPLILGDGQRHSRPTLRTFRHYQELMGDGYINAVVVVDNTRALVNGSYYNGDIDVFELAAHIKDLTQALNSGESPRIIAAMRNQLRGLKLQGPFQTNPFIAQALLPLDYPLLSSLGYYFYDMITNQTIEAAEFTYRVMGFKHDNDTGIESFDQRWIVPAYDRFKDVNVPRQRLIDSGFGDNLDRFGLWPLIADGTLAHMHFAPMKNDYATMKKKIKAISVIIASNDFGKEGIGGLVKIDDYFKKVYGNITVNVLALVNRNDDSESLDAKCSTLPGKEYLSGNSHIWVYPVFEDPSALMAPYE